MALEDERRAQRGQTLEALELGRFRGQGTGFRVALGGAVVAFLGCFVPWTNEDNYGQLAFGFETDQGKFFLLVLFAFAYLLWRYAGEYRPIQLVMAAVLALTLLLGGLAELASIENVPDALGPSFEDGEDRPSVQSAYGLWLYLAGAALVTVGTALMLRAEVRGPEPTTPLAEADDPPPPRA